MRSLGLIQDKHGVYSSSKIPFRMLSARLGEKPKGKADLSPFSPETLDQNGAGSCGACGVPCAAYTTLACHGTPLPWMPGQRDPYAMARGVDRARNNPLKPVNKLPPLQDVGTMLMSVVRVLQRWGIGPMGPKVKYNGVEYNCDCCPDNCNKEADLITLESARRRLVVGAYQITTNIEHNVQVSLDGGHAIAIGNFVDTPFMEYNGKSVIGAQNLKDPDGGGHCTYVVGYEVKSTGTVYICKNSWGKGWGDLGYFKASSAFINQAWETVVMDVRLL
jgi:hypothetical protein